MDHSKKLDFIHKMSKLGLDHIQHLDSGGLIAGPTNDVGTFAGETVGGGSAGATINGIVNPIGNIPGAVQGTPGQQNPYVQSNATNPNTGILGTIGGALGLNNNFQASSANVTPGTNAAQLGQAYTGAQNALANQQNLANTLAPQAQIAVAQQNALANQYAAMARGEGPNVAQNQLAQATGANVANQAALMAGQRGAGQNVGLLARQNAQTGAGIQQQAAGQAATLGAQQQIAAQNNLANLSQTQLNQTGQSASGLSSAAQGEQGILQNANTGFNNSIVGMQSNINNVNSQTAAANQNMAGNIFGGAMQGLSSISSLFAEGGEVDQAPTDLGTFKPAEVGGDSGPNIPGTSTLPADQTDFASAMGGGKKGGGGGGGGLGAIAALFAKGGNVHPGPHKSHVANYLGYGGIPVMDNGGKVQAKSKEEKATKAGNNYSNDKIPAMLSEGEVVIDRNTLNDPGPMGQMARAIRMHLEQRNKSK